MVRIIAYFMHGEELEAARRVMTAVEETESYVLGEVDESEIPRLREQGLIVERLQEEPEAETSGRMRSRLRRGRREREPEPPSDADEATIDFSGPNFYLIRLKGPLLERWRRRLRESGVELLERVPPNAYTAKLDPDQVQRVRQLPFVGGVRLYGPEDTSPVEVTHAVPGPLPGVDKAMLIYDVRLHRREDLDQVVNWLQERGVTVAGTGTRKVRFYLPEGSPLSNEIRALPEVAEMERYIRPRLHNDHARALLGIDGLSPTEVIGGTSQTGRGQTVAVADTGLDEDHPDFEGRVVGIVARGRPGDASDPDGHGTHVAGSVLGDGSAAGGSIRGTAPEAHLILQSLLDANGELGGLPVDLGDLFEEVHRAGARIQNHSWGARTNAAYTSNSLEVDEFVGRHRDALLVISAGNEGQAADRQNSAPGFVDWLSVGSPASSKNALTAGASRSDRTSGGRASLTYGEVWPDEFPDPPISDEKISGDAEALAAFSSRGPCDDDHIKPDVVAPGTDIASTKSSRAPSRNFWGAFPGNGRYAFLGGTSMAAPLVTGCAALVREYYVDDREHEPSAALLKATIINGSRWLSGSDSVADHPALPNFHQGFGCVYMPWTIPSPSSPDLQLEFQDAWVGAEQLFSRTGQRFRFQASASGGNQLRICLTWTDLPMRALQNDLDLTVQHIPSGQKWIGNKDLPLRITAFDVENNVEVVRVDDPPEGGYLVQVSAKNLLGTQQDFALVMTGHLTSSLVRV
jgi:serine protease AprX